MHVAGRLTMLGWAAFALYLATALLSFRAALVSSRSQRSVVRSQSSVEARPWFWLGVILAALGLNKPLNLQTALIELGRHLAGRANLSAHRNELHLLFFLASLLAVVTLLAVVWFRWRAPVGRFGRDFPLAATGCAMIGVYIAIRAVVIAGIDHLLRLQLDPIPFLWLLEAGGLALIIIGALRAAIEKPKS